MFLQRLWKRFGPHPPLITITFCNEERTELLVGKNFAEKTTKKSIAG